MLKPDPVVSADRTRHSAWLDNRIRGTRGYEEFAIKFAGCSFENGLYRFHDSVSGPQGEDLIREAFPTYRSRACPFAYDWLGRQLALDNQRVEKGEPLILLLEPGTGEALEVPFQFAAFHQRMEELREPALASSFFAEWGRINPDDLPLRPGLCVGYRIPLFLGGKDRIDNLEVIDLEVYWTVCGQLLQGTRELPAGTSIRQLSRLVS